MTLSFAPSIEPLYDRAARPLKYLRVSLTDRCNYRCSYCMPPTGWPATDREALLTLEEIARLVSLFAQRGVEKIRLTGGEPLLRKGIVQLVEWIAAEPGIKEIAMTTNGHALARFAPALWQSGLTKLTVSLDSFEPDTFRAATGGHLAEVLQGLETAKDVGFSDISLNVVAMRRINAGQLADIAQHSWALGCTPRFIELMPIGGLRSQNRSERYTYNEILTELSASFALERVTQCTKTAGPAQYWRVMAGPHRNRLLGTISPMSDVHFCETCNRARLTARGGFRPCLANDEEVSLLHAIRSGESDHQLLERIKTGLMGKLDAHRMVDGTFIPVTAMTGIGG